MSVEQEENITDHSQTTQPERTAAVMFRNALEINRLKREEAEERRRLKLSQSVTPEANDNLSGKAKTSPPPKPSFPLNLFRRRG